MTGVTAAHQVFNEWKYPPVVAELEATVLHPIMEYVRRRQETTAKKVACRLIYELFVKAERRPGMIRRTKWWDQDVVNEPEE